MLHRLSILVKALVKLHLRIKAFFGYHEIDYPRHKPYLKILSTFSEKQSLLFV